MLKKIISTIKSIVNPEPRRTVRRRPRPTSAHREWLREQQKRLMDQTRRRPSAFNPVPRFNLDQALNRSLAAGRLNFTWGEVA